MQFSLLWINLSFKDNLFGFKFCGIRNYDEFNRNLLAVYWNDGDLLIDFLWIRVH